MELVGHNLGQYHVRSEIAKGGMATVYLAEQASLGREVAIKVLPSTFTHDDTFLVRFSREVDVISGLQHPHILPVYDYGEYENSPYIVMAYLNGGTLSDIIREAPVSTNEVLRLVGQIANALDYAHGKQVIHRDFKPANVLLDEQRNTYLADFGLAKISATDSEVTGNAIVGTPTHMAPEQSGQGDITPATDIYALGVTVFQLLTGQAPYEDDMPTAVLMAHHTQPIPNIHDYRSDLPLAMQGVIAKAMAKDPTDRYLTATDLFRDLEQALLGGDAATTSSNGVAEIPAALLMTNLVGQVIFVDGQCLKILKRHHNEARNIIGKPLYHVLGTAKDLLDQFFTTLAQSGQVDEWELAIYDAKGTQFPVLVSAVATKDDRGDFVGADITLKLPSADDGPSTGSFQTMEHRLNIREETIVHAYFSAHIDAMYDLMTKWTGKRAGATLENIINETAERNVWAVHMSDGHVTVEIKSADADIYRALIAKATAYAIKVIGKKVVRNTVRGVDGELDEQTLQVAHQLGLQDVFDELL